jgi:hypothetical protein
MHRSASSTVLAQPWRRVARPTEKKAHLHQKGSGLQFFDKAAIITGE